MAKRPFRIEGGLVSSGVLQLDSASVLQAIPVGLDSVAVSGSIFSLSDIGVSSAGSMTQHHVLRWNAGQGKFISDVDSDALLTGLTNASNTVLGTQATPAGQSGSDNVAIGQSALSSSTGSGNVALGDTAGSALVSGSQNVIIGNIDGSSIEGKDGQMIMSNGAGTLIMSADSAQKVSMAAAMDVATVLTFGSTTETTDKISEGSNNLYWTEGRFNTAFLAKTTDSLTEGSDNLYYTEGRVDANFDRRTTDSLSEGSNNLYWTEGRFNTSFLAKTTDSLTEGSNNLYYTEERVNANFDRRTTDSLTEGSNNLYWTGGRFNISFLARTTDSLTEGSNNLYYTQDRFNSAFLAKTTDSLSEGSNNLYYTEGRFNTSFAAKTTDSLTEGSDNFRYYTSSDFDTSFSGKTSDSLQEGTVNLYFDSALAAAASLNAYVGGTGVTYDNTTGTVSIGQEVELTSDVKFGSAHVDVSSEINTAVTTTTATTQVAIDTFPIATFRSGTYTITITEGTDYQSTEMMVVHDDTSAYMVEFGTLVTGSDLADFAVSISGSDVQVLATPASANSTEFKVVRQLVGENTYSATSGGGGAGGDAGGSSNSLSTALDTSQEMYLDPTAYDTANSTWTNSIAANSAIVYAPSGSVTSVTNADGDVVGFDTINGGFEKTIQQSQGSPQANLGSFTGSGNSSYIMSYWLKDERDVSASSAGTDYHTTYLAETGGTLFEVTYSGSGVDNLNATIDAMSDGDALLLSAGEYLIESTVGNDAAHGQSLTRNKDIAIVGNTLDPKDVVVTGNPVQSGETYTIFEWGSTLQRQFANLRLVRKPVGSNDYQVAIAGNNPGQGSGKMKNVILDFDGGGVSWAYRGTGVEVNSIILENVSFLNYSSWMSNHASPNYHITVINSGFEGTYNLTSGNLNANSSNLVQNVSYDANYDYTQNTSFGHKKDLVVPGGSSVASTGHIAHMNDPYVYTKIVSGKFLWVNYAGGWASEANCPQTTSTVLSDGNWHHILIAYNNGTLSFWVDGVFDSTHSNAWYYLSSNGDTYITQDHLLENNVNVGTDGQIGAVRLFSADVSQLADADFVSIFNVDAEKYGMTPIS